MPSILVYACVFYVLSIICNSNNSSFFVIYLSVLVLLTRKTGIKSDQKTKYSDKTIVSSVLALLIILRVKQQTCCNVKLMQNIKPSVSWSHGGFIKGKPWSKRELEVISWDSVCFVVYQQQVKLGQHKRWVPPWGSTKDGPAFFSVMMISFLWKHSVKQR